jgi:hypothetical protein
MNKTLKTLLKGKQAARQKLIALPYGEKLALVEKLRDRSVLIASSPLRRPAIKAVSEPGRANREGKGAH